LADPDLGSSAPDPALVTFRANVEELPQGSANDDVEATNSSWTTGTDFRLGQGSVWHRETLDPMNHVWFAPDPDSVADIYLVSPDLLVSATEDLTLTFKHRYDFDTNEDVFFDGGVIEISVDGGAFTDIGQHASPTYPGTLAGAPSSNPLGGRPAYVGQNVGYPEWETVTVSLGSDYAGHQVKFRFRVGSDDGTARTGWQLDDFTFTGILGEPFNALVRQRVTCGNHPPEITPSATQTVNEGDTVTLSAQASDPDGDPLSYHWTQVNSIQVQLSGADQQSPTFTAPQVDSDQTLTFALVVSDGKDDSAEVRQLVVVRNVEKVSGNQHGDSSSSGCGCLAGVSPGIAPLWAVLCALFALQGGRRRRSDRL
jgi:hypothetical protein